MANFSGVVYAVQIAPPSPTNWLTAGYVNGRVKCMLDYYVALGTEAAASVLYMGSLLPVGAKILTVDLLSSANTASLTISIGDLNSATRYASASTAPQTLRISTFSGMIDATNGWYVVGSNPAVPTALNNDQQIILTTAGATLTVGQIYGVAVYFVTD